MSDLGPREPRNDMVICPNCTCQFAAIPVEVQAEIAALREALVWLDRQRDPEGVFKPVGMPERAFEAYLRATAERTGE